VAVCASGVFVVRCTAGRRWTSIDGGGRCSESAAAETVRKAPNIADVVQQTRAAEGGC
jgi:hypothetical protein